MILAILGAALVLAACVVIVGLVHKLLDRLGWLDAKEAEPWEP